MSDPIDDISSEDFEEFRDTFRQFLKKSGEEDHHASDSDLFKTRLLDLMLKPDSEPKSNEFRSELQKTIERISELSALELPQAANSTSSFLKLSFEQKNRLLQQLETAEFDTEKKNLWRKHIDQFFDSFIFELISRWEELESQKHLEELNRIKSSREQIKKEYERLRGIYALSLEIASLKTPSEIYNYLAGRLPEVLPMDAMLVLTKSDRNFTEKIFPVHEISDTEIDMARQKLEDFYELFQREVIDKKKIRLRISESNRVKTAFCDVAPPECIFVPLIEGDNAVGVIGGLRRSGNPFTPQEVQSISIVTNLVDLVLRNIKALNREISINKSLDDQIRFARNVQKNILPENFKSDTVKIRTRFRPSESISGDFYQFFNTSHGEHGVLIGDVTGHDVAAGLMMMTVMGVLTEVFAIEKLNITEMLSRANVNLSRMVSDEFFVTSLTLWLTDDNNLHYYNAGHPPGLLCRRSSGDIIELPPDGFPLGIFENVTIEPSSLKIEENDRILIYTDGLIETRDRNGHMFGIPRLRELFHSLMDEDCDEALDKILDAVYEHAGTIELRDDVAIVMIENCPNHS